MGVEIGRWVAITVVLAFISFPLIFMEFFFTRERVTEAGGAVEGEKITLREQMGCCLKSRS